MTATLNLIWGDANCGAVGKYWQHSDFSSPTALIKKISVFHLQDISKVDSLQIVKVQFVHS